MHPRKRGNGSQLHIYSVGAYIHMYVHRYIRILYIQCDYICINSNRFCKEVCTKTQVLYVYTRTTLPLGIAHVNIYVCKY